MNRYIDRDALVQDMKERLNNINGRNYADYQFGYELAIRRIENASTADVQEVKHGKWLMYKFGLEVVTCSNCGAVYEGGDSFRFCPKCGARMDLEEEKR